MKRKLMIAAIGLISLATTTPVASADLLIYNVDLSAPYTVFQTEEFTVVGTITVDMLGSLKSSDIKGYSLALTFPTIGNATLTPSTSILSLFGDAGLTATSTSLSVTLPSTTDQNESGLQIDGGSQLNFLSVPGQYEAFDIHYQGNVGPADASTNLSNAGGPYTLGTISPTVAPEPSTLAMAGMGLVTGLIYLARRRRRPRAD